MIKVSYSKNIEDDYYKLIADRKGSLLGKYNFEEYYNRYIKSKLCNYSLNDILCGDYEKLLEIKEEIGLKYNSKNNIVKKLFNYDKATSTNFKPKTSKIQPKISTFVENKLEIHTCYFCNIEFINKFKFSADGKFKNGFTLDHYIDKGKYPYLALSLYNLIPSCYTCNSKVKRVHSVETLSPTSSNFDFDDKVKFKTFMQNKNSQIEQKEDFSLLLKEDFSDIYKQYIDVFELDGRYEYHKYKVIEMINKRKEYPNSRIKELALLTQKTEEEVKQDLFGEYLFDDDNLHKRPLSKLIKDISTELRIV